jgi:DNA-binding GntR family transcriptional regulator
MKRSPTWEATPLEDRALRHSVAEQVLDAVRTGQLEPGARVHEVGLARTLGVSLSPVREALFRLADQGLLEHRPRRGFYVRELDEAETRDVFTFRALLEGFAARLLATAFAGGDVDAASFARLEMLLDEGGHAALSGDRQAVGAANARFHDALVRLAGNALLQRAWGMLAPAEWLLLPTWEWTDEPVLRAEALDWIDRHQALLAVLRAGDPTAAEAAMADHVRDAGQGNVRRRFPQTGGGSNDGVSPTNRCSPQQVQRKETGNDRQAGSDGRGRYAVGQGSELTR